jgi:hypothetical protein
VRWRLQRFEVVALRAARRARSATPANGGAGDPVVAEREEDRGVDSMTFRSV